MKTLDILKNHLTTQFLALVVVSSTAFAQAPVANFTGSPVAGCSPLVVTFQDLSTNNPTSWFWEFGNGNTSTSQNPIASYLTPGTYTVKLTVSNATGSNTLTRTNYINVYATPVVNFTANDTSGCSPHPIQFTDLSMAGAGTTNISWEWNFGDGAISTLQNPSHTYTSSGNYTVILKVTNDKGCFKILSKTQYIQVTTGVVPNFNNSPPLTCSPPVDINFTNLSTGPGILSYTWNFGDGGASTQANPTHIYNGTGSFTVTLVVSSSLGCTDSIVKNSAVVISTNVTSFTSPDTVCINSPVSLNNTSSPAALSQVWDFGDATSSTLTNPVKSYSSAGTYTILLTNNYTACTDTAMRTIFVSPDPVADFTTTDSVNCKPPLTVNFQNTSTGAVNWQWDFGDGGSSTLQNPVHTYTNYGDYTVTLVITNTAGCTDTIVKTDFIKIRKAVITIAGLPAQGCIPYTINPIPTVIALDNVTSYSWDFGDGGTSTLQNPSHTYTALGTYTVRLIITTSLGCTDTLILIGGVKAGTPPTADFTADTVIACSFAPVQFTDLSNPADDWLWDFGDGTTSTLQNPSHLYTAPGTYTVTLTARNSGCPDTETKVDYITVLPPVALFTATPNCSNRNQFTFSDISTGAITWSWNFGDGTTSTAQNPPPHDFPGFGIYTVSLTVTNGVCSNTYATNIRTINENPDFISDITSVCRGSRVHFTATGIAGGNISTYSWDFGDSFQLTTTADTISHYYNTGGNFTVTLITTDVNGCRDTVIKNNFIQANGPVANFSATNTDGCNGLTTTFTDLSTPDGTNPIISWQWNFGDGTIQTFTSPPFTHTYNSVGTFSVTLKITDAFGCSDTIRINNLVHSTDPIIYFHANNTVTCPGSTVTWGVSGVNYNSLLWDFGDGSSSTLTFPPKSYATPGIYTVKLFATDYYGCTDSLVRTNYITVGAPNAGFLADDSVSICNPFEVHFTNTSTFYTTQSWMLEPGLTSTLQNPSHYFTTPGTYNVELVITSPGGCQDTAYKTIILYDTAGFRVDYNPFNGCNPTTVSFNAVSTATPTYIWDFGDGQTLVSNSPTISYTYTSFGSFSPKVILQDGTGCLVPLHGADTIHIIGAVANFGIDKNFFCQAGMVNFTDSTTFNDPVVSYNWSFGDGNSSSAQNPSHNYSSPGLYNVSLIVQTQFGCTDTMRIDSAIKVVASPQVRIDGNDAACAADQILLTGNFIVPDTSIVTWNWEFGNGSSSTLQNPPAQIFNQSGDYSVTVIAINSSGCKDTVTKTLRIHPLPNVILPSEITIPAGTTINIPATYSGNMTNYLWTPSTFLNCTTCPRPDATPPYDVRYTVAVIDSNNCENTGSILIKTQCKNSNVFIPNLFSPNGDGSNDIFFPRGTGLERTKQMRIFNRWGEIVFEKYDMPVNNAAAGWDGTWKGKKANADTYVYQIEIYCQNGEVLTYTGNITLIR